MLSLTSYKFIPFKFGLESGSVPAVREALFERTVLSWHKAYTGTNRPDAFLRTIGSTLVNTADAGVFPARKMALGNSGGLAGDRLRRLIGEEIEARLGPSPIYI